MPNASFSSGIFWNPCVLPEGWTVKDLLKAHPSSPPNPSIAHVFFRSGEIETWGRSIERIFNACKEVGTPKPIVEFDGTGLTMEFRFSEDYQKTFGSTLALNEVPSGLESGLESMMGRVLKALERTTLSKAELAFALGHTSISSKLNLRVSELLSHQMIERTLPDKPNSRLQKYRLTHQGKAWLAQHSTQP